MAICVAVYPAITVAQGFAGLGTTTDGFALPHPDTVLSFPEDHGAHPDFRIEWWYLTATLQDAHGTQYGVQWTLFRSALAPDDAEGWSSPQVWMGHSAVTTKNNHYVAERIARGGIGQAGVTASPFIAFIDDWEMAGQQGAGLDRLNLSARTETFQYDLQLVAKGPVVLHGENGFSVKSNTGTASHYYSQPFYSVAGTLSLPDGDIDVTGLGWLDREWSTQPLSQRQEGWDWFALTFDNGGKLMVFQLREDGSTFSSGTWITQDGATTALDTAEIQLAPQESTIVDGRKIPTTWNLAIPSRGVNVTLSALNPNSWMATSFPYWEGPITMDGSHKGHGYLEMTGYE